MHLAHESCAGGRIEMVQEIGDQHQIVAAAKIGFEGAAGKQVVAIGNPHCLRILACDFEHILPIGCIDVCGGILFCRGDSEDAVTGGDIENFVCLAAFAEFGSHDLGGHVHKEAKLCSAQCRVDTVCLC